jgi:elongation factor P
MADLAGDIRVGNVIAHNGKRFKVLKRQHVQPGKGGAFYQMELKEIQTGQKLNERFRSEAKVDRVVIESIECQLLYFEGEAATFMKQTDFEQFELSKDFIGAGFAFLKEEMVINVEFADDDPIGVVLPSKVEAVIAETDPYVKNATLNASYKHAVLDNGFKVKIPDFVENGTKIILTVRKNDDGDDVFEYDSRA